MYFITLKRFRPWQIEFTTGNSHFRDFAHQFWGFWALASLYDELHKKVKNQNCFPKRQLKVEPSTFIIHAQTDEIFHSEGQNSVSRLAFL